MANRQLWPPTNQVWQDGWLRIGDPGQPAFGSNGNGTWAYDTMPLAYSVDPWGILRFRGDAKLTFVSGTPPALFTFPPGLRPSVAKMVTALCYDTANWITLRLFVTALGVVGVKQMAGAGTDLNFNVFQLSLDELQFRVEQ